MNKTLEKLDGWDRYSYEFDKVRLEICENGFSLWDKERGRWIIDASVYNEDNEIWLGNKKFKIEFKEILDVEEIEDL